MPNLSVLLNQCLLLYIGQVAKLSIYNTIPQSVRDLRQIACSDLEAVPVAVVVVAVGRVMVVMVAGTSPGEHRHRHWHGYRYHCCWHWHPRHWHRHARRRCATTDGQHLVLRHAQAGLRVAVDGVVHVQVCNARRW